MAPCWAQLWFWWGGRLVREGRHCFSAKTLIVGVAPSSQLLLVRNEDQQGILWSLHGYVAGAFSARDVFVGSGFTSVNVVELTFYCCFVNRWYPDIGYPWFSWLGELFFTLQWQHGDSGSLCVISLWGEEGHNHKEYWHVASGFE